jgi:hypothetical protein
MALMTVVLVQLRVQFGITDNSFHCSYQCKWLYGQQFILQVTVQMALLTAVCIAVKSADDFIDSSIYCS